MKSFVGFTKSSWTIDLEKLTNWVLGVTIFELLFEFLFHYCWMNVYYYVFYYTLFKIHIGLNLSVYSLYTAYSWHAF